MIAIILGLPHLRRGPLLDRALALRASLLISANALSLWHRAKAVRCWKGWNLADLNNLPPNADIILDSGGFTSHVVYGGFPWTVDDYVALAAAYPFRLFASFDYPVEKEIAVDRNAIRERISRTIGANRETRRRAEDHGIGNRLMPVLQGRTPDDYERCADALSWPMIPGRTIGVGSMCRRHVSGPEGLVAVVERLDRILPRGVGLHCFGVKGSALPYLSEFGDRVASIDSQAYGIAARHDAHRRGISKRDAFVAQHMTSWFLRQRRAACRPPKQLQIGMTRTAEHPPDSPWERALALARTELNDLIETGDLGHDEITEPWLEQWAADILHAA